MTPSPGAMRAAKALSTMKTVLHKENGPNEECPQCLKVAELIDRETHAAELVAVLWELYTFPGVRELLAPKESLGSIAAWVERALALAGRDA